MNNNIVIDVALTEDEILVILDILSFAQKAANVYAQAEVKLGNNDVKTVQQLKTLKENTVKMYEIMYSHLDIGQPPTNSSH